MVLYRTPLVSKDQPVVFLTGPQAGCVTPYFQQQLLNVSRSADAGASANPDVAALESEVASINTALLGKVAKSTFNTWTAATGTAERTTFATYTAPTASATYSQSEMQAVMNAVQILSRRFKAVIDDLKS